MSKKTIVAAPQEVRSFLGGQFGKQSVIIKCDVSCTEGHQRLKGGMGAGYAERDQDMPGQETVLKEDQRPEHGMMAQA